ncbi:MAG TPA: HEAT repeat domain-containing protein [Tepidisphaeraceae bacterium]
MPTLTEIFNQSKDPQVRAACIAGLTEMAERFQPPPLFAALSDPDPGVVLQGMFALTYFKDKRAVEPLCRYAESRAPFWEQALERLGELADPRAIPFLLKIITSPEGTSEQALGLAAVALGRLRPDGFAPLAANVNHPDPRVRFAVACGLDVCKHPEAAALLDKLESDPDERVRKPAQHRVGHMIPCAVQ